MLKTYIKHFAFLASASLTLGGCANAWHPATPEDPYEPYNRKVFAFNRQVDKYVYKPIAKGYDTVTPDVIQHRVTSFFSNVGDLSVFANDVLQANANWAASDLSRLLINTTIGIVGLWDPATHMGLPKHSQDLGLTFAKWGMRDSPYFIFPFLGPSTTRDFLGNGIDNYAFSPWTYVKPDWVSYSARGLDFIQLRAQFLQTDKLVDSAFDPYVFVRNFYLQNRKAKIQDVLHPDKEPADNMP